MCSMRVAIVGFEIEGKAAYDYWSRQDADITICDQNPEKDVPADVKRQLGPEYLKDLGRFDVVVRSAGVNPEAILAENPGAENKITTVVDEFLRVCLTKNVIGVTGTKGKGTTSTLIAKMLEAAGEDVHLGGNIGLPPLEFLPKLHQDSWVVLELSSFQLIDLHHSPHIAVCLMVVPEHLNWHADMDDYAKAKANLFKYQKSDDIAIYFAKHELSQKIAGTSAGKKLPYFAEPGAHVENGAIMIGNKTICRTDELKLLGEHNWQNVCAALTAVWQISQNAQAFRSVLISFSGLPHRLELVRQVNGVAFYNDSFAATPDAAIAALKAIKGMKVMIMGGFERNLPIKHVAEALLAHNSELRQVVLIGTSAQRLAGECQQAGFTRYKVIAAKTMDEIVAQARAEAHPGDAVVLSPGFASFDMFRDFEERGEQFKAAVELL
jgi:UDP-N-acetylmuramoylalanine--D-glutamate ligase